MPGSRWLIDRALVITFLACVAAFVVVAVDYAYLKAKQDISEQSESREDPDKAKRHVDEVCSSLSGFEWRQCALDSIEAIQQESQDTRDLHAQEWMARWAFWMFIVAAAGTVVAVYGLVLIKRTWLETKRTADVTREIGEAQVRAYPMLDLGSSDIEIKKRGPSGSIVKIVGKITNYGQSPAMGVEVRFKYFIGNEPGILLLREDDMFRSGARVSDLSPQQSWTQHLRGTVDATPQEILSGQTVFRISGFISYQDIFEKPCRTGWFCGAFHPEGDGRKAGFYWEKDAS